MDKHKSWRDGTKQGVVYFVRGMKSGLIKIGCSSNFEKRLTTLKATCSEQLEVLGIHQVPECRWNHNPPHFLWLVERNAHKQFAKQRERGEWFQPSDELYYMIQGLCA